MMLYAIIGLLSPICLANQELYDVFFFLHLFGNSEIFIRRDRSRSAENIWDLMADFSRIRISLQRYLLWTKSVAGVHTVMAQFTSEELRWFIWASVPGKVFCYGRNHFKFNRHISSRSSQMLLQRTELSLVFVCENAILYIRVCASNWFVCYWKAYAKNRNGVGEGKALAYF